MAAAGRSVPAWPMAKQTEMPNVAPHPLASATMRRPRALLGSETGTRVTLFEASEMPLAVSFLPRRRRGRAKERSFRAATWLLLLSRSPPASDDSSLPLPDPPLSDHSQSSPPGRPRDSRRCSPPCRPDRPPGRSTYPSEASCTTRPRWGCRRAGTRLPVLAPPWGPVCLWEPVCRSAEQAWLWAESACP